MTHTPSPTVIEEARKMAADYIASIYGERYREETLAGTRWVRLSHAFVAAIELGERRADAAVVGQAAQIAALTERVGVLREAGQDVVDQASTSYRARNGRQMSIEADDGEACEIVHSDAMHHLRAALKGSDQ